MVGDQNRINTTETHITYFFCQLLPVRCESLMTARSTGPHLSTQYVFLDTVMQVCLSCEVSILWKWDGGGYLV